MHTTGPIVVIQLPEEMNQPGANQFLEEFKQLLESDRPRIVLDCSQVRNIDSAGVESLLLCMEEAMKRNGDLKLAAVLPESEVILELMRVDRLFEMFETVELATQSFQAVPVAAPTEGHPWYAPPYGPLGELKTAS